jgi:hypothetical protein
VDSAGSTMSFLNRTRHNVHDTLPLHCIVSEVPLTVSITSPSWAELQCQLLCSTTMCVYWEYWHNKTPPFWLGEPVYLFVSLPPTPVSCWVSVQLNMWLHLSPWIDHALVIQAERTVQVICLAHFPGHCCLFIHSL